MRKSIDPTDPDYVGNERWRVFVDGVEVQAVEVSLACADPGVLEGDGYAITQIRSLDGKPLVDWLAGFLMTDFRPGRVRLERIYPDRASEPVVDPKAAAIHRAIDQT